MIPRSSHTFFDRKKAEKEFKLPGQCDEAKTPYVSRVSPSVTSTESVPTNDEIIRHLNYRRWCVIL